MHIAWRIEIDARTLRRRAENTLARTLTDQQGLGLPRAQRRFTHAQQRQPGIRDGAIFMQRELRRSPYQGEIAMTPADFEEGRAGTRGDRREPGFGEQFRAGKGGLKVANEELAGGNLAAPGDRVYAHTSVQGQQDRREFGSRIGVRQRAADGAARANRGMSYEGQCLGQQWAALAHQIRVLGGAVTRQSADSQAAIYLTD